MHVAYHVLPCNDIDHCLIIINTPMDPELLPQISFNQLQ